MWNNFLIVVFIAGFISFFEVSPQDSVVAPIEETDADSLHIILEPTFIDPDSLTRFQRDSIINVIPGDTSLLGTMRYFDGYLAERYASDDALNYERNINKSFFQRLKEMISAWIRKLFGIPDVSSINNLSDKILDIVLVVIFLVALYIVVRLFMNHRGRWFFEKKNETVAVTLSNVEEHIHEANFEALLSEAEQQGDTRQSVRLLYLWVLRSYTDNNIIRWNPDKTNIDYFSEIKDKILQKQFRYLSYLYNYIWYGGFSINDSEYRKARETFLRHIKTELNNE
ncbi:hypothetical protein SAMN05216365_11096 [Porphyromonadaceae bacterium NLAE-zl-C104]|nr:hypothetical protein SAMN05216331_1307 [Porphyromonadaceae bacterium KH3R12]SFS53599.1 hypothetical protein SAMN05216365_11096 [Porphyromonadaceae bacterium NLAE-zl-C104]